MYADDTSFKGETVQELEQLINRDKENLNIWLCANKLLANKTKTEFIIIASKYRLKQLIRDPQVKMDKEVVKRGNRAKLLGVFVDEKLD